MFAQELQRRGAKVGFLRWDIAEGKGIDDRLARVGPEKVLADLRLVRGLIDGDWDDDRYQVIPPGETLRMTYDESIMRAGPGD